MRLMVVAEPRGRLALAARLAAQDGVDLVHADSVADALSLLSGPCHADVVLIDATLGIGDLAKTLAAGPRHLPLIACGTATDADVALAAIHSGASEYLPIPTGAAEIAALIAALARDDRELSRRVGAASRTN